MGLHAGKGQVVHQNVVHTLSRYITNADLTGVYALGYVPGGSPSVASGVGILTAWSGTGNEPADLGFDRSEGGLTSDPNAFTETALDLDAAVGHIAGDVVSAANLYFEKPARITCDIVNTDSATGKALVYVQYIVRQTT